MIQANIWQRLRSSNRTANLTSGQNLSADERTLLSQVFARLIGEHMRQDDGNYTLVVPGNDLSVLDAQFEDEIFAEKTQSFYPCCKSCSTVLNHPQSTFRPCAAVRERIAVFGSERKHNAAALRAKCSNLYGTQFDSH